MNSCLCLFVLGSYTPYTASLWGLQPVTVDYSKSLGITANYWGLQPVTGNYSQSLGITASH